ncbi:MAG: hypothetical protein HQL26_06715 [Candidatus Omnitrophica bacterium]|nr:hypothetical protein [Candidatus Omnitrophota bacterium]
MDPGMGILTLTALTVGFMHTLLGPDHYIPFAALAQARHWNKRKTFVITLICGIGHVASSVMLGFIGITAGITMVRLKFIESVRGEITTWFLIAFGLTYFVWFAIKRIRSQEHGHEHVHDQGKEHFHVHNHHHDHLHMHEAEAGQASLTPWILFIIFFFGPCEPLIPLIMYPALKSNWQAVFMVAAAFSVVTVITMQVMVFLSLSGLKAVSFKVEKHAKGIAVFSHATAGLVIFFCGIIIKVFNL